MGTKKELLQAHTDELRESILKFFVEKRPVRNAVKRNLSPGDLGEPRTTLQCLGTNKRHPATSTNSKREPALQ